MALQAATADFILERNDEMVEYIYNMTPDEIMGICRNKFENNWTLLLVTKVKLTRIVLKAYEPDSKDDFQSIKNDLDASWSIYLGLV